MKITHLHIPDIIQVELERFSDERGWFMEFWNPNRSASGLPAAFVQDNIAHSRRGVLRGLHFQAPHGQGKLVTVTDGEVFDVGVDVRLNSATFGQWAGVMLAPGSALYIPEGFAHGYQVVSESATVVYKCTDVYQPEFEHAVVWNDPQLNIAWPIADAILSRRDQSAPTLAETRARLEQLRAV